MMGDRILLLNATYEPLSVIDWRRAVVMLFLEKIEPLAHYDRFIRGINRTLRLPAVVRLLRRVAVRPTVVRFSRANVYARDRHTCQYCGVKLSADRLTYDHVVPKRFGGKRNWTNIVTCCVRCNRAKGGRTPEQAGMRLKRKPIRPRAVFAAGQALIPADPPAAWAPFLWSH